MSEIIQNMAKIPQEIHYHHGFPRTLFFYVGRIFFITSLLVTLALCGLVSLFDFIDLLRRAASHPETHLTIVLEIAGLHIPYYLIYVLPFGILLGGIICFSRLARTSELSVMRSAGISAWQIISSPVCCAFISGFIVTTCFSPLSALCHHRAETLDERWLHHGGGISALEQGNLWLRQTDNGLVPHGSVILHIGRLHLEKDKLLAYNTTLLRLGPDGRFLARIEAPRGVLCNRTWQFFNAVHLRPSHLPEPVGIISLPSTLSVPLIRQTTSPPDSLSFWALPNFISLLKQSGFPTRQLRLHFQSLLALPVLAGTMALVSAGFSMRPAHRGGISRIIGAGIAAGFTLFTISKIAEQLGKSGALPPILAAWAPTLGGLCLAASLLLHMEDG